MTFIEFRADAKRVAALRNILETEVIREAFEAVLSVSPEKRSLDPAVSPHGLHVLFGQAIGYADFMAKLRLLATHPPEAAQVESNDYSQSEV